MMLPSGGSSSPMDTDDSALSNSSTPPVGSHEEPCGNSICFPLLLKHWKAKVEAETTDKDSSTSISSIPAPDSTAATQSTMPFPNTKARKSSMTEALHTPVQQTTRKSYPFQHILPTIPQSANRNSFLDTEMQRSQSSTLKPRRNPVRKAKSVPCIICRRGEDKVSRKRNITSSIVSRRKRCKAPEKLPPSPTTAPDLFNPAVIPEVIDKLIIPNLPQLPDFSNIHITEAAKLHMPELPKLNLPEIPKMPVPEVPRQFMSEIAKLGIPEIPKMAVPDFYKIFKIYRGSKSAPVLSHASMESKKEEREVTAESSAATTGSSDSPSVESWEWDD